MTTKVTVVGRGWMKKEYVAGRVKVEDGVLHVYAPAGSDEPDLHYPLASLLYYETENLNGWA